LQKAAVLSLVALCAVIFAVSNGTTRAQTQFPAGDPNDPKFAAFVYDVVSFKPDKSETNARGVWHGMIDTPDGFVMQHVGVGFLIAQVYRTENFRMSGAPGWLNSERYIAEAKMGPEVVEAFNKLTLTDQKLARKHMLQELVKDYLKLSVHMDSKEVPVYELQIAKGGPKLKEVTDPAIPDQGLMVNAGPGGSAKCTGRSTSVSQILDQLSRNAGRPVFDKTGLTGRYDFTLTFARESATPAAASGDAPPSSDAPDVMTAIQEQLGLKLVSAKGMMDVLVIDHVERPVVN
jgi:uncharacterized protein (TIGR03435 family)